MNLFLRNNFNNSNHIFFISALKAKLSSLCAQEEYLKSMIKSINIKDRTKQPQAVQNFEEPYPKLQGLIDEVHSADVPQPKIFGATPIGKVHKTVISIRKGTRTAQLPLKIKHPVKPTNQTHFDFPNHTKHELWNSDQSTSLVPINAILNPSDPILYSVSSLRQWFKLLDLNTLEPLPQPATNLAAYLPKSYTLTQLTKLGVNLSKIETLPGVANMLVKMDFKNEIEPFLWMFSDFGFDPKQMARILTVFPKVLKLSLDEVKSRIGYFLDHGFPSTAVVDLIHKQPLILQETSMQVDQKLGQIQNLFEFEGDDIRSMVISEPKVVLHPMGKIKDTYVILTKAMQFSTPTCRNLIRSRPKLLTSERDRITANFVIMHSRLNLPVEWIQLWPEALIVSPHLLTERSSLLVSRGLFQPDPKRPLYTPLGTVVSLTDEEFCQQFGRISVDEYDCFLRTL